MKNLKKKAIATACIVTMSLSVMPAPAFAVSSNIIAETENVNTLTISQIMDLAAIKNQTAQDLQLNLKQLELSEQMLRNQRSTLSDTVHELYSMEGHTSSGADTYYQNAATTRIAELMGQGMTQEQAMQDSQVIAWGVQAQTAKATDASNAQQLNSSIDSAYEGLLTIDDNLETLSESKDDLTHAMKDLESQMRYSSGYLALQLVQLDKSIALMNDQLTLLEKAVQIGELQKKLGMTTAVDLETSRANLKTAQNSLASAQVARASLARSLNVMIGRSMDTPLDVIELTMTGAIENAPSLTPELRQQFVNSNYTLKTLEREKDNLKKDGNDSSLGSDEKQSIDYKIIAKEQSINNQKDTIITDLRTLLNNIDSAAEAYRLSQAQLATERKTASYAEKRYELGMISQISKLSSDLSLKSAELTNLQNAYTYYLAWQKYNYALNGVDVSTLP